MPDPGPPNDDRREVLRTLRFCAERLLKELNDMLADVDDFNRGTLERPISPDGKD